MEEEEEDEDKINKEGEEEEEEEEDILMKDPNSRNSSSSSAAPPIVPSIHYPNTKEEGWWLLIVGDENEPVLGFEKVSIPKNETNKKKKEKDKKKQNITVKFVTPKYEGKDNVNNENKEENMRKIEWKLLMISDSWIGADQSLPLEYGITKQNIEE
jgi:hypothetical protein